MRKKFLALASVVLAASAVVGTVTVLPAAKTGVAETSATVFDSCVDVASDSWVSNGNGWRINRYGGRSITGENIGVTLSAYAWGEGNNALIWGGGGPSEQGFGSLYTGGDFALSFAATTNKSFAVVVDNYMVAIASNYIKIGYNDRRGVFGDSMMDYHPASWIDLYTGNELGGEYASTEAAWLTTQTVTLDSVVNVDVVFSTDEAGLTTVSTRVDGTVVTASSDHARITGVHTAIVSNGIKVYSQKVGTYEAEIETAVAAIDPALYVGALKATVDAKATEVKEAIYGAETLTASFASQSVAELKTTILELTTGTVVDDTELYLKLCKDVADEAWVSGSYGWMKGRYGGRSLSSAKLSCSLDAYSWDGTTNSLVWSGGGFPVHEAGRLLYQEGDDFAVSFLAEVPAEGFAVVVDNLMFVVTPNALKMGYNDMCGAFGDALQDYNPAYWLDTYTENGVAYAWLANQSATLSGVVSVSVYLGTDDTGVTTLVMKVGDTVLSTISSHTRIAGWHTAIVARNAMKVYSTQTASYDEQIDAIVAGLPEDVYTGEVKTAIDGKVAEAKQTLWNSDALTAQQASEAVASVMDAVLTYSADAYFGQCKDIADSAWASEDVGGWLKWANKAEGFNDDSLSLVLPKYKWATDHTLYWAGGTSGEGNLYQEGDDFAIKFIADMTEDGLILRVDNFSVYVNAAGINVGFNNEPGDGDESTDDFSRTYWVINIDILQERGGTLGAWLTKKEASLSGKVEIAVYLSTNDNGVTTIAVKAGDVIASAMTTIERKYLDRCILIAGYQDITLYSTKITDAEQEIATCKDLIDTEAYEKYADEIDAFLLGAQREVWEAETFTTAYLNGIVNGVKTMIADFEIFTAACQEGYQENEYSENGWVQIQTIIEQVSAGYFTCSVSEIEGYKAVAFERLDAVLTAEEEQALAELRANAKAEIDAVVFVESDYSAENWALIETKIADYKAQIDAETDAEQMNMLVAAFKAEAGSVLTLLDAAILEYSAELDAFVAQLTESEYSQENWQQILSLCNAAKAELATMTDTAAMESKVDGAKEAMSAVAKLPNESDNSGDASSDSKNEENSSKKDSGCGSSINVSVVGVCLLLCIVALIEKKNRLTKKNK